jgi:phospholipase/carboxylesterase
MVHENGLITIDNCVMRIQRPAGTGLFPVILLIHGWTGDENSMWVFAPRLPRNALLIAPRGLYSTEGVAGYSWHPQVPKPWPWLDDFAPAVEKLFSLVSSQYFPEGDFSSLHLVGFSQGAALAYSMAITYPERVASLAGLSGFLPDGASTRLRNERLKGLPVFIAHGTEDERVPVEKARTTVGLLQDAGAEVTYCEDTVGHKLSAKCFRSLEAFYKKFNFQV